MTTRTVAQLCVLVALATLASDSRADDCSCTPEPCICQTYTPIEEDCCDDTTGQNPASDDEQNPFFLNLQLESGPAAAARLQPPTTGFSDDLVNPYDSEGETAGAYTGANRGEELVAATPGGDVDATIHDAYADRGEAIGATIAPQSVSTMPGVPEQQRNVPRVDRETETAALSLSRAAGSDPVNPYSGELIYSERDYSFEDVGPVLELVRTYRSGLGGQRRALGHGWSFTFDEMVVFDDTGCEPTATWVRGDGSVVSFSKGATSVYLGGSAKKELALVRSSSSTEITDRDATTWTFGASGSLSKIADRNGNWIVVNRDANGLITSAVNRDGHFLRFNYSTGGDGAVVLSHVDASSGSSWSYTYDARDDLTKVTGADGLVQQYVYQAPQSDADTFEDDDTLWRGCFLACAPSGSWCNAGGACDSAITDAVEMCQEAVDTNSGVPACRSGCNATCTSFCGPPCALSCSQGCDVLGAERDEKCEAFCADDAHEKIKDACEEQCHETCGAWCNYEDCDSCIDSLLVSQDAACDPSQENCTTIEEGSSDPTCSTGEFVWAVVSLAAQPIGAIVESAACLVTGLGTGIWDVGECAVTSVVCFFGLCDADCDFDTVEDYAYCDYALTKMARRSFCRKNCIGCCENGDDCPANSEQAGKSCAQECFRGLKSKCVANCEEDGDQTCAGECERQCGPRCSDDCLDPCNQACDGLARDAGEIEELCEDAPSEAAAACTEGCATKCFARYKSPTRRYGKLSELGHNLLEIRDWQGNPLLVNVYGVDPTQKSFDRVISQTAGPGTATFAYTALTDARGSPKPTLSCTAQRANRVSEVITRITDATGRWIEIEMNCRGQTRRLVRGEQSGAWRYEYDKAARVSEVLSPDGSVKAWTYDPVSGLPSTIEHRKFFSFWSTQVVRYKWDYTDAPPYRVTKSYEPSATSPVLTFSYDARGNLLRAVRKDAVGVTWRYDDRGRPSEYVNEFGGKTTYGYTIVKRSVLLPGATNPWIFDLGGDGRPTNASDPNGVVTHFVRTGRGDVREVTYDKGGTLERGTSFRLDPHGYVVLRRDWLGPTQVEAVTTTITPNRIGWPTKVEITAPGENYGDVLYEYDAAGRVTKETFSTGLVTTRAYDAFGELASTTRGTNYEGAYDRDPSGRVIAIRDGESNTTRLGYDGFGRLVSSTDPTGVKTTLALDKSSRAVGWTVIDGGASGDVLAKGTNVYGPGGSLAESRRQQLIGSHNTGTDAVTQSSLVLEGMSLKKIRGVAMKHVDGSSSTVELDALGRVSKVAGLAGNSHWVYDDTGRVEVVERDGETLTYERDHLGRIRKIFTTAIDARLSGRPLREYVYSDPQRQITTIHIDGSEELRTFDALGRVSEVVGPQSLLESVNPRQLTQTDVGSNFRRTSSFEWRIDGLMASTTDGRGRKTDFKYDNGGELDTITYPDGSQRRFRYDRAARLRIWTTTGRPGHTLKLSARGEVLQELVEAVTGPQTLESIPLSIFTYDGLGNVRSAWYSNDPLDEHDDVLVKSGYDSLGCQVFEKAISSRGPPVPAMLVSRRPDCQPIDLRATCDTIPLFAPVTAREKLVTARDAFCEDDDPEVDYLVTRTYDANGRVTRIESGGDEIARFKRDARGRVSWRKLANQTTSDFPRLPTGELSSVEHDLSSGHVSRSYGYGIDVGTSLVVDESGRARLLAYDRDGTLLQTGENTVSGPITQLSSRSSTLPSNVLQRTFWRDGAFDLRAEVGVAGNVTTGFDSMHRIVSRDATGWTTESGGAVQGPTSATTWSFDASDNLTKIAPATSVLYDAFGRPRNKSTSLQSTSYVYVDEAKVLAEGTAKSPRFIFGEHPYDLVAFSGKTGWSYVHNDGLNSPIAVSDSAGKAVETYDYDAFGVRTVYAPDGTVRTTSGIDNDQVFTGTWELSPGLAVHGRRIYAAALRQFLTRDPIGHWSTTRFHLYSRGSPQSWVDRDGLDPLRSDQATRLYYDLSDQLDDVIPFWLPVSSSHEIATALAEVGEYLNSGSSWIGQSAGNLTQDLLGSSPFSSLIATHVALLMQLPGQGLGGALTFPRDALLLPFSAWDAGEHLAAAMDSGDTEAILVASSEVAGVIGTTILYAVTAKESLAQPKTSTRAPLSSVLENNTDATGFSGVYSPETGEILIRPSTSQPTPDLRARGWVRQNGGHLEVSELLGDSPNNLGFTIFQEGNAMLRVEWHSGSVNGRNPNFQGTVVPEAMRPPVIRALERATGRRVR